MNIKILLLFYLFFVVHELGHIVVALLYKLKFMGINFHVFGVNLKIDTDNLSYEKKLILYFAGPLTNIIISYVALKYDKYDVHYINMVLGLFNLVPVFPLDGGNMIKTVLEVFLKETQISKTILYINSALLIITIICYLQCFNIFYLALFFYAISGILVQTKLIRLDKIKANYRKKYRL